MLNIVLLIISIIISFNDTSLAADDTWKFFKPNNTTEESVITVFGAPDVVNLQTSYENLKKIKQPNGKIVLIEYGLSYTRLRGDLDILYGPLGEAASVEVQIVDGNVVAVDWDYSVKYKVAAEALWKRDKSLTTKVMKAITVGSKQLPDDNKLFVTCTTGRNVNCDGPIKVTLSKAPAVK